MSGATRGQIDMRGLGTADDTGASRNLWLNRTSPQPARQPATNCERGLRPAHTT